MSGSPQQRNAKGEPGKVPGRDRVGIVERSSSYRSRGVNGQVRDLVRIVGIVARFASRGVGTRGKFVLSSPRV